MVFVTFILIYALTGAVVKVEPGPEPTRATSYRPMDLTLYSLTAMTSPGNPPENMFPRDEVAYFLTSVQSFLAIFLIGLLGFVAGNRIRR